MIMDESVVSYKWNTRRSTKAKSGCRTCRIRKIKCDENKPFCRKCVSTGRTCDGYESPFRVFASQTVNNSYAEGKKLDSGSQPASIKVTAQDIDLLSRHFSIKTMLDVNLGCNEEARQVLQASLTDPSIRHALLSLRALRQDIETFGDAHETPSSRYAVQHYTRALGGLASKLSYSGFSGLKSALLCCQVFISIEQARKDFAAMAQHIIRGLNIIYECRPRPGFDTSKGLVPAKHDQVPLLDVFVIKLFAAPCKHGDPPPTVKVGTVAPNEKAGESGDLRALAPDMRTEITRISASALDFLDKVSRIDTEHTALELLCEKVAVLHSLESWLLHLNTVQTDIQSSGPEPVSISFLRIFYHILKMVLLGALDFSPGLYPQLQIESDQLQAIANDVSERVKGYKYKAYMKTLKFSDVSN